MFSDLLGTKNEVNSTVTSPDDIPVSKKNKVDDDKTNVVSQYALLF